MIGRRGLEKASSRLLLRNVLILSGSISYAAILFLAGTSRRNNAEAAAFARPFFGAITQCERSSTSLSFSVARNEECKNVRTRKTAADLYFEQHKKLPKPKMMHATLEPVPKSTSQKNILVIGDVHGCFEELKLLHQKALKENGGVPFRYVILVGDLCQKGPDSAQVVRYVREQPNWLAVRGNHDNAVLEAALGDSSRRKKKKYKWVMDGEREIVDNVQVTLSDDDVVWLSELPYTITIPGSFLQADSDSNEDCLDTTIVHAGLVPGLELEDQSIETMVTIREVDPIYKKEDALEDKDAHLTFARHGTETVSTNAVRGEPVPWASVWKGPNQIIFGHDARRGLQLHDTNWATGLDTGAVYGKKLTSIILPERRLVQVEALKEHSPVG